MENPNVNQSCKEEAKSNDEEANPPNPPPCPHSLEPCEPPAVRAPLKPCTSPSRARPPLNRARPPLGRSRPHLSRSRPHLSRSSPHLSRSRLLANVRAFPSIVRAPPPTHARNAGVENHLTFDYAISTYSINEG
jgi:hypothetical protein